MRSSHNRAIPVRSREQRIVDAGVSGARALTRMLVALIENLGQHDQAGPRRVEPRGMGQNWPHGTTLSAFGPSPLGPELERLMARGAPTPRPQAAPRQDAPHQDVPQHRHSMRDAVTGLPLVDETRHPAGQGPVPAFKPDQTHAWAAPGPLHAANAVPSLRDAPPGTVGFARGQVPRPKRPPAPPPAVPATDAAAPISSEPEARKPDMRAPDYATANVPNWQQPFIAAPGVRYMRTPDHLLRRLRDLDAPLVPIRTDAPGENPVEPDATEANEIDIDGMDGVEALHIENEAAPGSNRGLPRRLKMTSGFGVDVPEPANDPALVQPAAVPGTFAAQKQAFNVTIRPKALRQSPVVEAPAIDAPALAAEPAKAQPARVSLAAPAPAKARRKPAPTIEWVYPSAELLGEMRKQEGTALTADMLEQNARLLESTLEDFGIRGEIIHVRAGPVVTLYELEPAPGTKSSRVIGLADDIARSMSAVSARVAVVAGRNAIGIELPNERRETVYFREMIESEAFSGSDSKLAIALGKTIGGEPVIAELAKMPHLLVAGTTGSGKSVAINTMILSLLYRLKPEECRLIMVDPKMLELSVYDGIPHLLTPVVTDPKKAVVALKWAVREMEDRYKKMSKLGVRNIDGFNRRIAEAKASGEAIMMQVTTGFDRETGKPIMDEQPLDLVALPYIVVIVDEMADLMMVAGKDIEGAIQRLAQMARAAGIHLIMATQRPSVDVITGTIKANFPTRISFQVTSKIDSRTILGEMGAEQLLGQGDMLHMQGGGRIYRVHGPFVSDEDVERVVAHLKSQRAPDYLDAVTDDLDEMAEEDEDSEDGAVFDKSAMGEEEDGDLYDQAVKIVLRDKKSSISYVQRRLSVGYNKAASLIERMEKDGILSAASHTGKREILAPSRARIITGVPMDEGE